MQLISLADIARAAGVKPAAVSNWRRRHPDTFPRPVVQEGRELFHPDEVATWLTDRRIDRSSLLPGETEGCTYGDRFRTATGAASQVKTVEETDGSWTRLIRLHAIDAPDAILDLVATRLRDESGWAVLRADAAHDPVAAIHRFLRSHDHDPDQVGLAIGGTRAAIELLQALEATQPPATDQDWALLTENLLEALSEVSSRRALEHYTPPAIADLMLSATAIKADDRVCDPCCGTGGLLVRAAGAVSGEVRGHALLSRSARMARLALKLRGRPGLITDDAAPSMEKAPNTYQVVITNPPFALPAGGSPRTSRFGPLPARSAMAWLCDAYERLAPGGRAAVIQPTGATFRQGMERDLRAALVMAGVVERIIALPPGLFANTGIAVTLWILSESRRQGVLMVDGTDLGHMADRSRRKLSTEDIALLGSLEPSVRSRLVGFDEIRELDYNLNPSRYVVREKASSGDSLADRLRALERAERAVWDADARAWEQLRRIIGGSS